VDGREAVTEQKERPGVPIFPHTIRIPRNVDAIELLPTRVTLEEAANSFYQFHTTEPMLPMRFELPCGQPRILYLPFLVLDVVGRVQYRVPSPPDAWDEDMKKHSQSWRSLDLFVPGQIGVSRLQAYAGYQFRKRHIKQFLGVPLGAQRNSTNLQWSENQKRLVEATDPSKGIDNDDVDPLMLNPNDVYRELLQAVYGKSLLLNIHDVRIIVYCIYSLQLHGKLFMLTINDTIIIEDCIYIVNVTPFYG
jgi:hypothetical protein